MASTAAVGKTRAKTGKRTRAALPRATAHPVDAPPLALGRMGADVANLKREAATDEQARLVLGDAYEEHGHDAIAALLRCTQRGPMVARGLDRPDVMAHCKGRRSTRDTVEIYDEPQIDRRCRKCGGCLLALGLRELATAPAVDMRPAVEIDFSEVEG